VHPETVLVPVVFVVVVVHVQVVLRGWAAASPLVDVLAVVLGLDVGLHPGAPLRAGLLGGRAHLLEDDPQRVEAIPEARQVAAVPRAKGRLRL